MYECYTVDNMINKFFTNPGRFIKMFFAVTAVLFFVGGMVNVKTVHAADLESYIGISDSWLDYISFAIPVIGVANQTYSTGPINSKHVEVKVLKTDEKSAEIEIIITPSVQSQFPEDTNKDGLLNKGDTLVGFWDALLGDDDITNDGSITTTDGVFLEIKDAETGTIVPYTVGGLKNIASSTHGNNITSSFWINNPQFFQTTNNNSKTISYSTIITISDLATDKNYTAQVFLEEDASWDTYYSNPPTKFNTTKKGSGIIINPSQGPKNQTTQTQSQDFDICTNVADSSAGIIDWSKMYCQLVKFVVEVITLIPNVVAAAVGTLNDWIMNISIGHSIYKDFEGNMFTAWKIVRDIANIIIIMNISKV